MTTNEEGAVERIIPENVFTLIVQESTQSQSQETAEKNANISHSNNLTRLRAIKGISTTSPAEARTIDKILTQPD